MSKRKKIQIKAETRTLTGKKVKHLRAEGKLLGVVYGRKLESINIMMNAKEVTKQLRSVSSSTIVEILLGKKTYPAILRGKQRHPLKDIIMHVDFQAVSMDSKLRVDVPVIIIGISPAVETLGAFVTTGLDKIDIEVSAVDMPESFVVDVSNLIEIGDSIAVEDLGISEDIIVYTNLRDMLAVVTAPTLPEVEEEEIDSELDEDGTEPEVVGEKSDDEE